MDSGLRWRDHIIYLKRSNQEINIFTDSSKTIDKDNNNNIVGCSVWIPSLIIELKYKLNSLSSSFTAEIWGILKAIDWIIEHKALFSNICTDSKSSLDALFHRKPDQFKLNTLIRDLQNKLLYNTTFPNGRVRFTWCPAHVGIRDN
ncbi:hypothetical protein ALC60_09733 [Trachymyrmex zeteki]|uniref:RNase H type-1 domain-containing protein n=1 Tax=Mycetomoellerius zeteki TaxID=64791 RepID=A0A151WTQ8_9HYME|nr:hypothetical protein ALC60_09733 [Trachymyrmex zeteki]